jgi:UDP-N-acetylglucosamine 2-epimerase (non-hydrolysing)
MAPVVQELRDAPDLEALTLVSAQHRRLLDQVLEHFAIRPDADLDVMVPGQSLTHTTTAVLERLEPVLREHRPGLVLVHGDTTTTLAASLAAYYAGIPVGHVEAGLRTGDRRAPFPEEMNRRLADALCEMHFAPTPGARENLLREGLAPDGIFVTGNTAIDALLRTAGAPHPRRPRLLLCEAHRRENFGQPMEDIVLAVRDTVRAFEDLEVVYSVHPNPRVKGVVERHLAGEPRVSLRDPFDYVEWARLMAEAYIILTDSGGIQEEAPSLGVPVVLVRDKTERPEAVQAGTVVVAGTQRGRIAATLRRLCADPAAHRQMARAANPFGDGHAAARIVGAIRFVHGLTDRAPEPWGTPANRAN